MNWQPIPPPFKDYKRDVFSKLAKVSQFIYQVGEYSALRQPSQEIAINQINSDEMQSKFAYIKNSLRSYRKITGVGRGITAVQVGIPERFSVIYTPEKLIIIVNPQVTKKSDKLLTYSEVCMSFNPVIVPTVRPEWIEFGYLDEHGKPHQWNTKNDTETGVIMNRVFQHEIDHMNGIINVDKVSSPKQLMLESDPDFYKNARFEEVT
jgi:peptide deformylase